MHYYLNVNIIVQYPVSAYSDFSILPNFVSFAIRVNQDIQPFNSENCVIQPHPFNSYTSQNKIMQFFFK